VISPVDPAKPSWFSFPPGTEPGFDFTQQNGTTPVHVIVAPTDATPGSYAFKLRAVFLPTTRAASRCASRASYWL
jgi:hypothetical protein